MARNVLFLLVRVLAITSAIFIPVISQWGVFVGNYGVYASSFHNKNSFIEFQQYFRKGLDILTAETRKNSQFFLLFLFIHLMLVASHAIFRSAKFGKSMMRERVMHLVSSFWLPLPFLTIRGVDRGEEKAELWFLIVLHSLENFVIVSASRLVYLKESYPLGIVIFDCVLVVLNFLGVLVSVFYVSKIELYADLPQDLTSLPSFGPEVSFYGHSIFKSICSTKEQELISVHFQDLPTSFENVGHEENQIVDEEGTSQSQEEERREAFVMSKPDGNKLTDFNSGFENYFFRKKWIFL